MTITRVVGVRWWCRTYIDTNMHTHTLLQILTPTPTHTRCTVMMPPCSTLQHTATHCNTGRVVSVRWWYRPVSFIRVHVSFVEYWHLLCCLFCQIKGSFGRIVVGLCETIRLFCHNKWLYCVFCNRLFGSVSNVLYRFRDCSLFELNYYDLVAQYLAVLCSL